MLALNRQGYTLLILSPRLSTEAYISLLEATRCTTIVTGPDQRSATERIKECKSVKTYLILDMEEYESHEESSNSHRDDGVHLSKDAAFKRVAYIMHSSGSTGHPKPIYHTHLACIENYAHGSDVRGLSTVPFYHTHGHAVFYRTIAGGGTIYLLNAHLPITTQNLEIAIGEVQPSMVFAVPYTLKLLAESPSALRVLSQCQMVSTSGSACPDALGDRLVEGGVNLVSIYGT